MSTALRGKTSAACQKRAWKGTAADPVNSVRLLRRGMGARAEARYVLNATNSDESVAAFRRELLDCVAMVAE